MFFPRAEVMRFSSLVLVIVSGDADPGDKGKDCGDAESVPLRCSVSLKSGLDFVIGSEVANPLSRL